MRFNFLRKLAAVVAEEILSVSESTLTREAVCARVACLEWRVLCLLPRSWQCKRALLPTPHATCSIWGLPLVCVLFSACLGIGAVGGEFASLSELSFCFMGQNVSWPRWYKDRFLFFWLVFFVSYDVVYFFFFFNYFVLWYFLPLE